MKINIDSAIERQLTEIAGERAIPLEELVGRILTEYVRGAPDDMMEWVRATQNNLQNVWPPDDFSDWNPPTDP